MRAKDIQRGGVYWTKIGGVRVQVKVVYARKGGVGVGRTMKYQVERVDNGTLRSQYVG